MLANDNWPDGAPSRQRLPGAERRAAIVRKAVELFSQHGFRGTTTRQLAAAVGVSEPVLYQHFATKHDLYTAIVDQLLEETQAHFAKLCSELPDSHSEREFFEWLANSILTWQMNMHDRLRLLLFSTLEGHELSDMWYERATQNMLNQVQRTIQGYIDDGRFVPANATVATEAFIGMVAHHGMMASLYEHRAPKTDLSRQQIVSQLVDHFLNGIRVRQ